MIDKGLDHRGVWRAIYCSLWDDPEFLKFTRVEKLVFLNLRTGPQSNLPVIFRYTLESIIKQTRTKSSSIRLALRSLSDKDWIKTEDGIVWIKKGLRFDPNIVLTNPKHLIAIKNIILSLPKLQIVRDFIDYYKIPIAYPIASRIAYPIPYANQDTDTDTEEEKDTEKEEDKEYEEKEKPQVKPLSLFNGERKEKKPYYPDSALSDEERSDRYRGREAAKAKSLIDREELKKEIGRKEDVR